MPVWPRPGMAAAMRDVDIWREESSQGGEYAGFQNEIGTSRERLIDTEDTSVFTQTS